MFGIHKIDKKSFIISRKKPNNLIYSLHTRTLRTFPIDNSHNSHKDTQPSDTIADYQTK